MTTKVMAKNQRSVSIDVVGVTPKKSNSIGVVKASLPSQVGQTRKPDVASVSM
jgi:hypothetical protein